MAHRIGAAILGVLAGGGLGVLWLLRDPTTTIGVAVAVVGSGLVSALAPLVTPRLGAITISQGLSNLVSPLGWPSAWITVFRSARNGSLALAALGMSVQIATAAAVMLLLPTVFGISVTASERLLVVAVSIIACLLSFVAGFLRAQRQDRAAEETLRQIQERDDVARRIEQAKVSERERLNRELHDHVGNRLALLYAILESSNDSDSSSAAKAQVVKARQELRALIRNRSLATDSQELSGRLRELFDEAREAGLEVSDSVTTDIGLLPHPHQLVLFEFYREGVTNALKYAAPGLVIAAAGVRGQTLAALLSSPLDDSPSGSGTGLGLKSLSSRVAAYGGTLEHSAQEGRFDLRLRLPLDTTD